MGAWLRSETFWLDLTNIGLGVVTLVCVLAVGIAVVQDLLPRLRSHAARDDDHALLTPELGWTMADGGRRIERKRKTLLFWRRGPR